MKKFCLIGKSLSHSMSAQIHGAFGLDYGLVELPDEECLREFLDKREYDGFNVTIPFKEQIIKYLDGLDDEARQIGAVNTVVKRGEKLFGHNTDIGGMAYALKRAKIDFSAKSVMILGSGGTSKTARHYAQKCGAKSVFTVSRQGQINYENCYDYPAEVLINTTPVGMFPDADKSPVDLTRFKNVGAVFDAVYNPLCTRLLMRAKELGLVFSNGLNMLVEQARLARDLFLGDATKENLTREVFAKLYFGRANIVLIGLGGCGKTEVGRAVAKKLNREFLDTDEMVQKKSGKSVRTIFAGYGEAEFRRLEREAVAQASCAQGAVIATGGGAPVSKENRDALKSNGVIVYIMRPLEMLELTKRPLYTNFSEVKRLFVSREPIYRSYCDAEIDNVGTVSDAADKVIIAVKNFIEN
jgi:shikimate dehydrogenase